MTEERQDTTAVALREAGALPVWRPQQTLAYAALVHAIMREVLREGVHYGIIPGTEKRSLWKPGAEKLGMTFRLSAEFHVDESQLGNGHIDTRTRTVLKNIETGQVIGDGVGSCSTMESKYRWRQAERTCPACGKPAIIKGKAEYGGGWVCFKKKGGCGDKYLDGDRAIEAQTVGRVENPDIADTYNTVRKMSKKRSHIDAIITATGASDIFTQDIEDEDERTEKDVTPPKTAKSESPAGVPRDPESTGPVAGVGYGPASPAGDVSPEERHALAVEDWKLELAGADSLEKLAAMWKTLEKPTVWSNFKGGEQVALRREHDKRKSHLATVRPQGNLV